MPDLKRFSARHPGVRTELKTKRFINGRGGWRHIDAQDRKDFLTDVCRLAVSNGGKIYGLAISYPPFDAAINAGYGHPFGNSYWLAGALFTGCLVQKKMQTVNPSLRVDRPFCRFWLYFGISMSVKLLILRNGFDGARCSAIIV